MKLSKRLQRMEPSATIEMAQMARNLAAKGHHVINLSLGEPDFDTPEMVKDAAKKALDDGYTKYTPVPGLVELRNAIVTKLKRDNNLTYTNQQIVVSTGAKQSIANIALSVLEEGDEAVVFAPFWVSYKEIIRMTGAEPIYANAGIEDDFKVTPQQLKSALTPKTKMVIFSSPCNPTGSVFTQEELNALGEVLKDYPNVLVVSDEIYEYINFTGQPHASIAQCEAIRDRVVVVNGFAKGFAMTGWRLGYIAGPQWLADACAKIQGQFTSGANAFAQRAAVDALLGDMSETYAMRDAYLKRRDLILGLLKAIDGVQVNNPTGAFYVFPNVSAFFGKSDGETTIHDANDLCQYILLNAHVAIVDGAAFGAPDCVRFSYAASEDDLREAVKRIKAALEKLK